MLSIEAAAYFVPDFRLKVEENLERFNLTKAQAKVYTKFYGLQEIPYAKDMSLVELIAKPIEEILNNMELDKRNIKYIIHSHTAKVITRFGRSVIREVKERLQLPDAVVFGTSLNNCASTLNALEIAQKLLCNENCYARAIIVTGERAFTKTVQIIPNTSITGDASAAILLNIHGRNDRLIHLEMNTVGKYSRGIWLTPEENKAFENQYVPLLSETIVNAVKHSGLKLSEIKLILPHNVNLISWIATSKNVGYPASQIYLENVKKYSHCFGSDIVINYVDAIKNQKLDKGDYFMMATVGIGATFAAAIFQH